MIKLSFRKLLNNDFAKLVFMFGLVLTVLGCEPKEPKLTAPNEIVEQYFDALFNEKDFEKVLSLATEGSQETLQRYGSCQAVARYLYNLNFEFADVYAERPSGVGYINTADSLRINVAITGFHHGRQTDEAFEMVVKYEKGSWKVDRMLPRTR